MQYGERVKAARTSRGWSQEFLALECGMNTRTIAKIEKGEANPKVTTHRKLTELLGEI